MHKATPTANSKSLRLPSAVLCLMAFLLLNSDREALAYSIDGSKWPGGEAEFYVSLSGVAGTGVPYEVAFIEALQSWNEKTDFNFILRKEYRNPCGNDQANSVDFTDTVCGSAYGENTLAVTLRDWQVELLGPPKLVRADIVINRKIAYNVYDGNLVQVGIPFRDVDFRRVALHELGHAIGLDHSSAQQAIMRSTIGNTFALQHDDIDGVNALYGGLMACAIAPLSLGQVQDSLSEGDCKANQLTVGGSDDSFVDVRQLVVKNPTRITVEMRSATLDSVLLLADDKLRFLMVDDNGGGGCDARLSLTLQPGTYYVISNTYDTPINSCTNTGPYTLQVSLADQAAVSLGGVTSVLGGPARAVFTGAISADNGFSFGNRFRSTDSLDITASVSVDPLHVGEPGFIVVAALVDGQILLQDQSGTFREYKDTLHRVFSGPLKPTEPLVIARDLVPAQLGITSIHVEFLVGYGLDANPGQIFYHQQPISLTVEP